MNMVNSLMIFTTSPNIKLAVILLSHDMICKQNEWWVESKLGSLPRSGLVWNSTKKVGFGLWWRSCSIFYLEVTGRAVLIRKTKVDLHALRFHHHRLLRSTHEINSTILLQSISLNYLSDVILIMEGCWFHRFRDGTSDSSATVLALFEN